MKTSNVLAASLTLILLSIGCKSRKFNSGEDSAAKSMSDSTSVVSQALSDPYFKEPWGVFLGSTEGMTGFDNAYDFQPLPCAKVPASVPVAFCPRAGVAGRVMPEVVARYTAQALDRASRVFMWGPTDAQTWLANAESRYGLWPEKAGGKIDEENQALDFLQILSADEAKQIGLGNLRFQDYLLGSYARLNVYYQRAKSPIKERLPVAYAHSAWNTCRAQKGVPATPALSSLKMGAINWGQAAGPLNKAWFTAQICSWLSTTYGLSKETLRPYTLRQHANAAAIAIMLLKNLERASDGTAADAVVPMAAFGVMVDVRKGVPRIEGIGLLGSRLFNGLYFVEDIVLNPQNLRSNLGKSGKEDDPLGQVNVTSRDRNGTSFLKLLRLIAQDAFETRAQMAKDSLDGKNLEGMAVPEYLALLPLPEVVNFYIGGAKAQAKRRGVANFQGFRYMDTPLMNQVLSPKSPAGKQYSLLGYLTSALNRQPTDADVLFIGMDELTAVIGAKQGDAEVED